MPPTTKRQLHRHMFTVLLWLQLTALTTSMQSPSMQHIFSAGDSSDLTADYLDTPPLPELEFYHGTTTLSFVFNGGIVAAVDSRASMGKLVGSRTVDKVLPVSRDIIGTMAGGAADCLYYIRALSARVRLWELTEGVPASAEGAAHTLAAMIRQQAGLSVGTMIMGHDRSGEPCIYYIDDSGACVRGDIFAVGSGSPYAISVLDSGLRADLTVDEATDLALRAIQRATHRDAFSGGYINVFHITKERGWRQVRRVDSRALPSPHRSSD